MFNLLSEQHQEILRLIEWDELSLRDAAAVLNCSYGAARVRLHRASRPAQRYTRRHPRSCRHKINNLGRDPRESEIVNNTRRSEVLALLRNADPAKALPPSVIPSEVTANVILNRRSESTDGTDDAVSMVSVPAETPSRLRSLVGTAAILTSIAAIIATVWVVVLTIAHDRQTPAAAPLSPTGQPAPAIGSGTSLARTRSLVHRVLAGAPLPAGAESKSSSPTAALNDPPQQPGTAQVVQATTWGLSSRSSTALSAFFERRAWTIDSLIFHRSGEGNESSAGQTAVHTDFFQAPDQSYAIGVTVLFSVTSMPHGSAYRIDAQAVWITDVSHVTLVHSPRSALVRLVRPDRPELTRSLTETQARRLADLINELPSLAPGLQSCPAEFAHVHDVIRFETPDRATTVDLDLGGCANVNVHFGRTFIAQRVDRSALVNASLVRMLQLPRSYLRREK